MPRRVTGTFLQGKDPQSAPKNGGISANPIAGADRVVCVQQQRSLPACPQYFSVVDCRVQQLSATRGGEIEAPVSSTLGASAKHSNQACAQGYDGIVQQLEGD